MHKWIVRFAFLGGGPGGGGAEDGGWVQGVLEYLTRNAATCSSVPRFFFFFGSLFLFLLPRRPIVSPVPHFQSKLRVEEALKAVATTASFSYTILRPALFMDNWAPTGMTPITAGTVPGLAAPDVPVKLIAVADIGRAAAVAFGDAPTWGAGRTISLAGDEQTGAAVAATVARVRGRGEAFAYVPAPREALREAAPEIYEMARFFDHPGYTDAATAETREILPDALTVEAWLEVSPLKGGDLPPTKM